MALAAVLAATGRAEEMAAVGFDRLAGFEFKAPAYEENQDEAAIRAESLQQIPADIRALNGRRVRVSGFMLPVKLNAGKVVEMLLISDPMICCYGAVPRPNEWITVRLKQGIAPEMDVLRTFSGLLKVGPVLDDGYLTAIYEMEDAAPAE